jgi:hypothetical protein
VIGSAAVPATPIDDAEVQRRVTKLAEDLEKLRSSANRRGKRAYIASFSFMIISVVTSVAAAILGIFGNYLGINNIDPKIVGGLALIPGVISIFPTNLKLQGRADWHYRKKDAAQGLLNDLMYCLSVPPSAEEVRKIAKRLTALNLRMGREWETNLGFVWSANPGEPGPTGLSNTEPDSITRTPTETD